jgi:hypothetical protein
MKSSSLRPALLLCALAALAACSQQADQSAAPATQASSQDAAASRQLDTYRQLLRIRNDEMAVTMGHAILDRYPQSAAAKEVQQTLPAIEKRWKETSEKTRLAGLWLYQVSPMEGGTQSTATIYSSQPSGNDRVRLVLRRHTDWGQNAFLYGSGHGFVCRGNCTLAATFDGKPVGIKAFAPPSGEPALMIRDDKAFIARLEKAKKITIDVTPVDAAGKQTLVYEVGGFVPAKWQGLPKAKAGGHKKR